jgi:divalent metal cation (Fe/Co/Zn/Cd) transporter
MIYESRRNPPSPVSFRQATRGDPELAAMNSPTVPRGAFLLLQDEAPLAPKGHGALASLIRHRGREEEEAGGGGDGGEDELSSRRGERRMSAILNSSHMRSMRLIGNSNPRYRWERYWKTEAELAAMPKHIRKYHERVNYLVQQYLYIDKLLDSSLPHDLLNEYNNMPASAFRGVEVPATIMETSSAAAGEPARKVRRTPKAIYRPTETTPLISAGDGAANGGTISDGDGDDDDNADDNGEDLEARRVKPEIPWLEDDVVDSDAPIVTLAIYINFAANAILLAGKIAVIISVPSVSVLASLVDALLDFLSTVIVWITTLLIRKQDQYRYPVGRRRLEPLGVLVFSVIMITSFVQVALEAIQRLASPDHGIIKLGIPAISIMLGTIVIKGLCWLWCRLVNNSSVQALAADASTDVIFNAGSIAFPIVGFYAGIWWLDALGGLILSLVVIFNWSQTSFEHIRHLSGFSATADQRNIREPEIPHSIFRNFALWRLLFV